ncbi:hypothetical protein A2647_01330 [Candidatus Nomurabacteria bacterium RIFCSPHIGHO2_01_FULL_40_24b]|uniref:Uncharacterized protein n=1 Tax=Candidatus Nomurabacteria bacterium RIFCSPHIGHO2_01_FULL_40_24b TaxID=1801739 RepID=A0A1F6V6G0_9BACT|nr:MAG: hypothetical protein A2647_01330 [Candidatus Nomurabacteria bacterium RIFCSPHIGHO2_01_FULL_40_24b]
MSKMTKNVMIKEMIQKILILNLSLVFMFFFVFGANFALAQIKNTDIVLEISPKNPAPNQSVRAIVNTSTTDLKKAYISWSVNGEKLSAGIGRDSFSFNMGSGTSFTELAVTIDMTNGQSVVKTINISPAEVDLLWEAYNSYVPPFYRGKALVASEGTYKVVAMPSVSGTNGKISSNNLSYAWKKNYKAQPDDSGWGKRFLILKHSYIDTSYQISVEVSDVLGKINASSRITLAPSSAKIVFYRVDPVLGIKMENAIEDGHKISKGGETIIAVPYFVTPKNLNSLDLEFKWLVGGIELITTTPRNLITVIPEEGKPGTSVINLNVENIRNLFEGVTEEVIVSF